MVYAQAVDSVIAWGNRAVRWKILKTSLMRRL